MSLRPEPIGEVPAETAGGQPGLSPWRLALVTVFQFLEQFSDRQAADAVRGRIDWKNALGLELTDPGFHFSVPTEFRARLVAGGAEHVLLDRMLERFKARGKQRTDSTHVLGAVHDLHLLELVAETLRAALDDLAAAVPDWLRAVAQPEWFDRDGRQVEDYRLSKGREEREALALVVGIDGFTLLGALDAQGAPAEARAMPLVHTLRDVWRVHHGRDDDGRARWRPAAELPPVGERLQSPYDPEMHYSTKRQMERSGYKVHVTETCDEDAAHLVTHVRACPAMEQDMTSTAEIHQCRAVKGLLPAEHFVDSPILMPACWSAVSATTASRWRDRSAAWRTSSPLGRASGIATSPSTGSMSKPPHSARRADRIRSTRHRLQRQLESPRLFSHPGSGSFADARHDARDRSSAQS